MIHPFSLIVSGPSLIGKTTLVYKLLRQAKEIVHQIDGGERGFDFIIVLYQSSQPLYHEMQRNLSIPVQLFEKTLPTSLEDLIRKAGARRPLLIIDDGITSENQSLVADLFTRLSHHLNVSVILICQSLFDAKQPTLRLCHRNAKYLIIFPCIRDMSMFRNLVYQMNTDKKKARQILQAIEKEFQRPHGYVLIDFHPLTPAAMRFKTNILRESAPYTVLLALPDDLEAIKGLDSPTH